MTESPGLVALVREALEGVLSPPSAASSLFEALDGTSVPTDRAGVIRFVDGPLRNVLVHRLGNAEAASVVDRILMPLEAATRPGASRRVDEAPTRALPLSTHAVPVTVVAETSGLASRLRAALGAGRIDVSATPSAADALRSDAAPAIVIVDASDFPPTTVDAIVGSLRRLPTSTACVIYAAELPFGARLVASLDEIDRAHVPIARSEGVDPLMDLVRARRL